MQKYLYPLLAAALGFGFTYILTHRGGIGVSPDSIAYISAARNLAAGGHLKDYTGHALVDFPAGFPTWLAFLLSVTGKDPLAFTPFLHPLLFAVVILLCGYMADRMGYPSTAYKPLLLLCIALSPGLVEVYIMLWSETLFILLSALFMIAMERYVRTRSLPALLAVALCCAVACTVRYAGVTMAASAGLLILLDRYPTLGKKFLHLFVFGGISVSLLVVNLTRNYLATGTLTGMRQKGMTPLLKNIYYYGNTFSGWFLYGTTHYHLCLIIGLVLITLLVVLFTRGIPKLVHEFPPLVRIALTFSLVYSVFMVISATLSRYETINSRLLSPLYIPLILCLAFPLGVFARKASTRWSRRGWRVAAGLCLFLVLSSQLLADHQWYSDVMEGGIGGYTEDTWNDSPLVAYLKTKPAPLLPGFALYSNSPEAVYFFTGQTCQLIPQKAFPGPIREYYATPHQYLVWVDSGDNDAILTLDEVLSHKDLVQVRKFDDGAVYITTR